MKHIKGEIHNKIVKTQKLLQTIDEFMSHAPAGSLKCQKRAGKTYYYHQVKNEKTGKFVKEYIKKNNQELAKVLAQKGYYSSAAPILQSNLQALEVFYETYREDIDKVYDELIEDRKCLVQPIEIGIKEQIRRWRTENYEPYDGYIENLRYETERGEMVRSKSEVIIADILYRYKNKIDYKYERPLTLMSNGNNIVIYPDFTILNLSNGRICYWEHAGRMDDAKYADDFVKKYNLYLENDMYPGKDLIVTHESKNCTLDIRNAKKIIGKMILES